MDTETKQCCVTEEARVVSDLQVGGGLGRLEGSRSPVQLS